MKNINIQNFGDKAAVSLSFLCIAHCIVLPLLIIFLPLLSSYWISSESFHLWLLIGVLFNSSYAISMGYFKHAKKSVLVWVVSGLSVLLLAFFFGARLAGELGEKALTVIGALIVAFGHLKNFQETRKHACNR
jgi:hypothetical protein